MEHWKVGICFEGKSFVSFNSLRNYTMDCIKFISYKVINIGNSGYVDNWKRKREKDDK